ncbi:hypothetical protein [Lonsdalea quercina]|uniref:hypothetical protein n=1 Tax=Lonsdalea quercina TaxID=71657 RepID=UPI003975AE1A
MSVVSNPGGRSIKFLQYGIDAGKCGFVIANKGHESDELFHELIEHRAGTGKSPSYEDLMYANLDTSRSIHSRMARYDRNMKYMTESLSNKIKNYATVISPWLSEHPSCQISKVIYGHGGRVAYLRLHNPPDPVGTATLELYRIIGVRANERQIPLIAASNFGFSMPHYHIVRHEKFGLSLRISSGSIDSKNLERVINFLAEEITQFQLRRHHA